jgi:hypothetical protein
MERYRGSGKRENNTREEMKILLSILLLGRVLTVMHQPYVPFVMGQVSQWEEVQAWGVTGLLAHDWREGQRFYDLEEDDILQLVYNDGTHSKYVITDIMIYSYDTSSDDFYRRILVNGQLVLVTCARNDGRVVILAKQK